jgi:hypothetical protein
LDDENTVDFYEWLSTVDNLPESSTWDFLWNHPLKRYIERGGILRSVRINQMKKDVDLLGYECEIEGYKCLKVNYSSYESISDAGHYICDDLKYPVAWIWHEKKNNLGQMVKINNLRGNGQVDVSKIAVIHGGGGHKGASGFVEYPE